MNAPVNFDPRHHAMSLPIDKFDLSDPQLFYDDIWPAYFARHRKEAPVNYIADSAYGPYWSVAKYKDIVKVEVDHKTFSSSDEVSSIDTFSTQLKVSPRGSASSTMLVRSRIRSSIFAKVMGLTVELTSRRWLS